MMKTQAFKKTIRTALTFSLIASILAPSSAVARGSSSFSRKSVEALIQDYYRHVGEAPEMPSAHGAASQAELTDADRAEYALDVLDEIALFPTEDFNDIFLHMMIDYRNVPEHRAAIEALVAAIQVQASADPGSDAVREALREELGLNSEFINSPERTYIKAAVDAIAWTFVAAYAFQGVRGLYKSCGSGLTGMPRFIHAVDTVKTSLMQTKNARGWILAAGGAAAAGNMAHEYFRHRKVDPAQLLLTTQSNIVHDAAVLAAAMRDESRAMNRENAADLRAHAEAYRKRIVEMESSSKGIRHQLAHIFEVAAHLRGRRIPIAEDLAELRTNLARLRLKLGSNMVLDTESGSELP